MTQLGHSWFGALFGHAAAQEIKQLQDTQARLEGQLREAAENKAKLAALEKSQAVIEFSLDGRILHANDNFLRTMGYTLDEVRGQHHCLFVEPEARDSLDYRLFWQKLGRGEFDAGQYRRLARDGRAVWLEATYNPIFDAEGRPYKVVKFASDITAQVLTNQALQAAVEETQGVVTAAQAGDLSARIPLEGKHDAIHTLCEGINRMLEDIEQSQARERRVAEENARIRVALDNVSTAVMIADTARNITYMNDALRKVMREAEADLSRAVPEFDTEKLIGQRIDIFFRTPEHQAHVLDHLRGPHRAQIELGGRTLALVASPVFTSSGERLGTAVEWKDRTHEVALENEVAAVVMAAAQGDLNKRVSVEGMEGFVRVLGEGINRLLDTTEAGLGEVARVLGALSQGDLTEHIEAEFSGTFGALKDHSNETVAQLTEIVSQIKQAADSITTATKEIAAGNADLSRRTEEQAASLEETASSMDQITGAVKQNAENAKQANHLAIGASSLAQKGGDAVGEVVDTMKSINESAKKIVDIIAVIDGIAFQTNILALNAAVEAARAGEQGRGFAVVASEVRNLAQRSAAAAKEIKSLISDSVEKVQSGSQRVGQAGEAMTEVVAAVKRVTHLMGEIAAASVEQSAGIEQVNQAISQMDEVTQHNAALVEEAAAAAESMLEQADGLTRAVGTFRLTDARPARAEPTRIAPKTAHKGNGAVAARPRMVRGKKTDAGEWEAF